MNRIVFALVALAPALVAAQPGPTVTDPAPSPNATNGAPQNESWSNISHINGQLVPVGERTNYLLDFKKTNISTNPIGWMFGFYGVSVSQAVSQNIAIRADANYFNASNTTGYEAGISAPIYFKRTYYGPFIEPGLIVRQLTSKDSCYDCYGSETMSSTTSTMAGPEVLFGYQMTFDSGLNVAAAFGAARNLAAKSSDSSSSSSDVEPAGYFRVGYAF